MVRNKLVRIRKFLKFIDHPLGNDIQLPKIPNRGRNVIKVEYIRNLLNEVEKTNEPCKSN